MSRTGLWSCGAFAVQAWSDLDPQATHYINAIQLTTLIQELLPPLGVKGEEGARAKVQAIIMHVDIPVRNGKVSVCWRDERERKGGRGEGNTLCPATQLHNVSNQ